MLVRNRFNFAIAIANWLRLQRLTLLLFPPLFDPKPVVAPDCAVGLSQTEFLCDLAKLLFHLASSLTHGPHCVKIDTGVVGLPPLSLLNTDGVWIPQEGDNHMLQAERDVFGVNEILGGRATIADDRIKELTKAFHKGRIKELSYQDRHLLWLSLVQSMVTRKLNSYVDLVQHGGQSKDNRLNIAIHAHKWLEVRGFIQGFRWYDHEARDGKTVRVLRMCVYQPMITNTFFRGPYRDEYTNKWHINKRDAVPKPRPFSDHVWIDILLSDVIDESFDWNMTVGMQVEFYGKVRPYDNDRRFGFGRTIITNVGLPVLEGYKSANNQGHAVDWIPASEFNTVELTYVTRDYEANPHRPWKVNESFSLALGDGLRNSFAETYADALRELNDDTYGVLSPMDPYEEAVADKTDWVWTKVATSTIFALLDTPTRVKMTEQAKIDGDSQIRLNSLEVMTRSLSTPAGFDTALVRILNILDGREDFLQFEEFVEREMRYKVFLAYAEMNAIPLVARK